VLTLMLILTRTRTHRADSSLLFARARCSGSYIQHTCIRTDNGGGHVWRGPPAWAWGARRAARGAQRSAWEQPQVFLPCPVPGWRTECATSFYSPLSLSLTDVFLIYNSF